MLTIKNIDKAIGMMCYGRDIYHIRTTTNTIGEQSYVFEFDAIQDGQVPTPQTCAQRSQVIQLISENRAYIEAKNNYDGDIHLQQQIGFKEWFELMKNFVASEEKKLDDFVTVFGDGFTPFRIEDAQYATLSSFITAHKVGVLNEKRCKK